MNEIDLVIPSHPITLAGKSIVRLLPYAKRRLVGPFIFLDHLPETTIHAGDPLDVPPHPHIGLSTLTYLYAGEIEHRDSLGNEVVLKPRDVNWMTAGKGVAHSERTPDLLRESSYPFHMLQFWVALPKEHEEDEPSFEHHDASTIPEWTQDDAKVRLIAGSACGKTSPVKVFSKLFFMSIELPSDGIFEFETDGQEAAMYVLNGAVDLSKVWFGAGSFVVFKTGESIQIHAKEKTELILFGGATLPEPRTIYWNFVATDKAKIEAAKKRWQEGAFPKVFHDETEFVPLPPQF